ncbi:hypothetical protein EVAR_62037_1 [Eumeta japonica]|uniref:Uncharacterized protein n=1 Tax=Eumeta variegata TaxID=151549 RepID=A0A4C1YS61_EUMVA|nr:hypothetical protein EVAR_62037_1 [Eumeta japonica]
MAELSVKCHPYADDQVIHLPNRLLARIIMHAEFAPASVQSIPITRERARVILHAPTAPYLCEGFIIQSGHRCVVGLLEESRISNKGVRDNGRKGESGSPRLSFIGLSVTVEAATLRSYCLRVWTFAVRGGLFCAAAKRVFYRGADPSGRMFYHGDNLGRNIAVTIKNQCSHFLEPFTGFIFYEGESRAAG